MASVDLKHHAYTIPIHNAYQKYFKFRWYQKFYKCLGMPNQYSDAMRVFSKMLKPPLATLQKQGFTYVILVVDDSYFQRRTRGKRLENVYETVSLLTSLGFTIHMEKSVLEVTHCVECLGIFINSAEMAVKINLIRSQIITEKIKKFLENKNLQLSS